MKYSNVSRISEAAGGLIWLLLPALLLISGCQRHLVVSDTDIHFDHPEQLQQWTLRARMGYRSEIDSGNASLEWQQDNDQGQILFSGPMGFGSARLSWDSDEATLETARETLTAPDLEQLSWRLTGLWLPIEALRYWIRGLAWPGAPSAAEYDNDQLLAALKQMGWQLRFDRHQLVHGLMLPHRIRANHGDDRFTLVIQQWQPQP